MTTQFHLNGEADRATRVSGPADGALRYHRLRRSTAGQTKGQVQ